MVLTSLENFSSTNFYTLGFPFSTRHIHNNWIYDDTKTTNMFYKVFSLFVETAFSFLSFFSIKVTQIFQLIIWHECDLFTLSVTQFIQKKNFQCKNRNIKTKHRKCRTVWTQWKKRMTYYWQSSQFINKNNVAISANSVWMWQKYRY